jgi:CheY-like chemotaxis protein
LLRATTPSSIEVRLRLEPQTPSILGDPTQIHQIIINLASNAVQAIPETGGWIEISSGPIEVTAAMAAEDHNLHPGPYARVSVTDNGAGMDPAIQSRIFDPFFTTKGPGHGTGLGLAVVHGIVRKHLGAIKVTSSPGQGAHFDIIFPASNQDESRQAVSAAEPVAGGGRRIMLVDDEPALTRVGRLMLERLGFKVTVFTDSPAAWNAFAATPGDFELVISDQTMPRLTGLELANRMLKLRPALPVILMTGYHASANPERVREAGVAELLMKPFTFESLNAALHQALR